MLRLYSNKGGLDMQNQYTNRIKKNRHLILFQKLDSLDLHHKECKQELELEKNGYFIN